MMTATMPDTVPITKNTSAVITVSIPVLSVLESSLLASVGCSDMTCRGKHDAGSRPAASSFSWRPRKGTKRRPPPLRRPAGSLDWTKASGGCVTRPRLRLGAQTVLANIPRVLRPIEAAQRGKDKPSRVRGWVGRKSEAPSAVCMRCITPAADAPYEFCPITWGCFLRAVILLVARGLCVALAA